MIDPLPLEDEEELEPLARCMIVDVSTKYGTNYGVRLRVYSCA